jgi:hypothetical protein
MPDDINTMTHDEISRAIAEGIGLRLEVTPKGCYWPEYEWFAPAPDFAGDYNASLATKDRDGYNGPVAWLYAWREGVGALCTGRIAGAVGHVVDQPVFHLHQYGPRALAIECLRAIWAVKGKDSA